MIRRLDWPIWPHLYTLAVVMVGWVFFRAETLPAALAFLKAMAGAAAGGADAVHGVVVPDAGSSGWRSPPARSARRRGSPALARAARTREARARGWRRSRLLGDGAA